MRVFFRLTKNFNFLGRAKLAQRKKAKTHNYGLSAIEVSTDWSLFVLASKPTLILATTSPGNRLGLRSNGGIQERKQVRGQELQLWL